MLRCVLQTYRADFHPLRAFRVAVANDDGAPVMPFVAHADPPEAVGVIPVVPQLAVRKELARADEVPELLHGGLRVLAGAAVQVAPEDARVAGRAREDERIGERLERRRDPALKGLANLLVFRSARRA